MVKLKIKVTEEILDRSAYCGLMEGSESITSNCAIALAVREIFPYAEVGDLIIDVYNKPWTETGAEVIGQIYLPAEATLFINMFDSYSPSGRRSMNELEFEVQVPDDIIKSIDIDEIKNLIKNSETLTLVEA